MLTKLHFKIEILWLYFKKHWIISSFVFLSIISSVIFHQQIINFYNLPVFHPQIIGLEGRYTIDNLPDEISQKISLGLTVLSDHQKPEISKLVKSLEIQNENKDYIFTLNDNIYWSSGKKFTAYDINYEIPGLTITPLSTYSVKISSETEFSPLLSSLTQPLIKSNFDGLGDYAVTKINYQEGYIKTLHLKSKDKHKNSVEYRFYFDQQDVVNAYKIGNVDIIKVNSLPTEFNSWGQTKITKEIETTEKYVAIFINTQKINSKQIRQALAYATPKGDKNERCLGPISPNSWAYYPAVKEYNLNKTRAKELLGEEKIENIDTIVNYWKDSSDQNFETMQHLLHSKDYSWALFIGHLVIEKLLKALYVKKIQKHALYTHDLLRLTNKIGLVLNEEQEDWLDEISTFNLNARYDNYKQDFQKKCTKEYTFERISRIENIRLWLMKQL